MRIEFAYPLTVGGTDYTPDTPVELDDGVAASLINDGFARKADAPAPAVAEKAAPKTTRKESA